AGDKAAVGDDRSAPGEADRTATRAPRRAAHAPVAKSPAKHAARTAAAGPVVRTERVSETHTIPFQTMLVRDPSLPRGSKRVQTRGVPGERVLHYEVTYTGTKETARRLVASTVTREPQHRVIAFGNRQAPGDGHDGRDRDRDRDRDRWCGDDRGECTPAGRAAVCSDETMPEEENLLDQHLGLLSAEDLNALDLTLPCDEGPAPAEKPEAESPGRT
ncbi:G5 domain-containing protein, partial [Couchioplanes caeruleus]